MKRCASELPSQRLGIVLEQGPAGQFRFANLNTRQQVGFFHTIVFHAQRAGNDRGAFCHGVRQGFLLLGILP